MNYQSAQISVQPIYVKPYQVVITPQQQSVSPQFSPLGYNPYLVEPSAPPPIYVPSAPSSVYIPTIVPITSAPNQPTSKPIGYWRTGLCDCCSDCSICLCGLFALPCLFGYTSRNFNDSSCFCACLSYLLCCGPLQHCKLRSQIREKYNIQSDSCNDFCATFICCCCAMCQEAREVNIRSQAPFHQSMV